MNDIYDLIIEAKKFMDKNAGIYTKRNAIDFLCKKINFTNREEILKEIEKEVPGFTKEFNMISDFIELSKKAKESDVEATNTILNMSDISPIKYKIIEQYSPNILRKIKTNNEPDYSLIDIFDVNMEKEALTKELKKLEEQKASEDKIFPLNEEEKQRKEKYLNELALEQNNALEKLKSLNNITNKYSELYTNYYNIDVENIKSQKETLENELRKLEEQRKTESQTFPFSQKEIDNQQRILNEIEAEKKNNLEKLEKLNYALLMNENIKKQEQIRKEKEHIRGLQENKTEISRAIYNGDVNTLLDYYKKGIISEEDLKNASLSSEFKENGEQTKDIYKEVMDLANKDIKSIDEKELNKIVQMHENANKSASTVQNEIQLSSNAREFDPYMEELKDAVATREQTKDDIGEKNELAIPGQFEKIDETMREFKESMKKRQEGEEKGKEDIPTPPEPEKPEIPEKPEPNKPKEQNIPSITLEEVLAKVLKDLPIYTQDKKTQQKLKASNIKVSDYFHSGLHTGNVLYNIASFAKTVIGAAKIKFDQITAKKMDEASIKRVNELRERLDNLTNEEKEVIFNEYKGQKALEKKGNAVVNNELSRCASIYGTKKAREVASKNVTIYFKLMNDYKKIKNIDKKLEKDLPDAEKQKLLAIKASLLNGKAKLINEFNLNNNEAKNYLSAGVRGVQEDIRSTTIGQGKNYEGYRFAEEHDTDQELIEKEAELKRIEREAITKDDDEKALNAFADFNFMMLDNTKIEEKLLGNKDVGKRHFSPVEGLETLNYEQDTFYRDAIGTIALAAAVASAGAGVFTHITNNNAVAEFTEEVNEANDTIHQIGKNITDQSDKVVSGMEAHTNIGIGGMQGNYEIHNTAEPTNYEYWTFNSDYRGLDEAAHAHVRNVYETTNEELSKVVSDYQNGNISSVDAVSGIADISNKANAEVVDLYEKILPGLKEYAEKNPQFDYTGIIGSVEKVVQNPDAVVDFNNGVVEILKNGEKLSEFNIDTIGNIKSNLAPTLASALATSVSVSKFMTAQNKNEQKATNEEKEIKEAITNITKEAKDSKKTRKEERADRYTKKQENIKTAEKIEKEEKKENSLSLKEKIKAKLVQKQNNSQNLNSPNPENLNGNNLENNEKIGPTR